MISKGFRYGLAGEIKFSEIYGTYEVVYECDDAEGVHNITSRGRMLGSPKCRPGISPLIFSDFLLGKAVFLDLPDMSKYLPQYNEIIKIIPLEEEIAEEYHKVTSCLREMMKSGSGKTLLSSYLQFALSYTDKPYGRRAIISPIDGAIVAKPESFDYLTENGTLLNKEKYLIDLINSELGEGRNVFIYCEYTGEPDSNVTHRLRSIIEENCVLARDRTTILESQSPQAVAREAWMQKKATEGIRVFLTNPKCVETGIDLIFYVNGIKYNYPTLIFYQLGYNLFTIWQASRRAYRLIQTEECRTYYLASDSTIQTEVIRMIGEKQAATAAIQGAGFSAEGLSAMANSVDPRVRLANAVASECENTEDSIQSMFDVLHHKKVADREEELYEPMLTFYELLGYAPDSIEDYAEMLTIPLPGKRDDLQDDLIRLVFGDILGESDDERVIDLNEDDYRELPKTENESEELFSESAHTQYKEETSSIIVEEKQGMAEVLDISDELSDLIDLGFEALKENRNKNKSKISRNKPKDLQMTIMDLFSA